MMKPGICISKLTGPRTGDFVVFHFCFGIIWKPPHNGSEVNGKRRNGGVGRGLSQGD